MTTQEKNRLKIQVQRAIQDPDSYSLYFIYIADNKVSLRAVSPYRWDGGDTFVGLCLSRQNHRSFRVDRIHKMSLVRSSELLMPFPVTEMQVDSLQMESLSEDVAEDQLCAAV